MATANKSIWVPSGTTDLTPLQTPFALLAQSVDDAMVAQDATIPALVVADVAARTAKFPSPVQGNRVWRTNLGGIEAYYGAYNAGTNPGGATPAGWYPISGKTPTFMAFGSGVLSVPNAVTTVLTNWATPRVNSGFTSWASGVLTIATPGEYEITAGTYCGGTTTTQGIIDVGTRQYYQDGSNANISARELFVAGSTINISVYQYAGSAQNADGSRQHLSVKYIGPA